MTQPTERRFVMEPRLDAEVETLNTAIEAEETARIAADALKVAKAGDTMTGALVLPADPTSNLEAATKQYVDNTVATGTTSGSRTVYVKAGMDLTKGQPVYISGANGTNVIVSAAGNGSEATSSKTIGLINSTVSNNGFAYVTTNGLLAGLDTSAAGAAGDAVWLGPSGTLLYGLANKPYAPAHLVYIGVVTKKNGSTGEILINPQNGFELEELHNVYINSATLIDGDVLKYDEASELWINGVGGGGASVTVSDTAPATPEADALWYDSTDGTLYVYYEDVNGSQWVQVQANSALTAGIESRVGALESTSVAYGNMSTNYVINGAMDVWQRGTSFSFTSNTPQYTADRWYCNSTFSAGSSSVTQQAFTPGAAPVAGYEGTYFMRMTAGSTASWMEFSQRIEDVRTAAGTTVTLSFWAKASATTTFTPMLRQNFGTSGSSNVDTAGSNVTLTTSWARYTATIVLPSISGKTINANNYLAVFLYASSPSGSQTIDLWGVQLERGTVATAFRRNGENIAAELTACQRYYWRISNIPYPSEGSFIGMGTYVGSTSAAINIKFPVEMRVAPTSIEYAVLKVGAIGLTEQAVSAFTAPYSLLSRYGCIGQAIHGSGGSGGWATTLYVNPNQNGYIGFTAEL